MADIETVDGSVTYLDPLYSKQKEGVAKMRASLLSCTAENMYASKVAINTITSMRIYHQLSRIIKYLEMMDKIEDKMYASMEANLDRMSVESPSTWMTLLTLQERLQKSMIESHKLLQPYLDLEEFNIVDYVNTDTTPTAGNITILDTHSRNRVRNAAQSVLSMLDVGEANG